MLMKKLLKNPVRKAEKDRTTAEKVVRNVIFVALVAFASIMVYKVIDAEMSLTEESMLDITPATANAPRDVDESTAPVEETVDEVSGENAEILAM